MCVFHDIESNNINLEETDSSKLSMHLGVTKMFQNLKKMFWWPKMKKGSNTIYNNNLICQKIKIKP